MFVKFAQGKKLKEMKSLTLTVLSKRIGLVMVLCCPIVIIGLDLQEECTQTEDGHVTRGNFTCCASSPESVPLQLSINFESGWKKCAVEPGSLNEDPVISSWRVYRCIIFQGIYGKPLLPTTFTNFYAAKYPPSIKSQIFHRMSELENGDMKFEADVECLKRTPYPKVHLLRNLFFDVEQDVCEAGNNQTLQSDLDTATRNRYASSSYVQRTSAISPDLAAILCETCDRTKAMYHRNGDCCSHVPIPFPFMFLPYRYGNNERVNRCAEDLADDVGLPADSEFSTHLQYLCYPSCEFYLSGVLDETDLWAGVTILQSQSEIRNLVMKMMPKYLSSKYKQNILHYVLENFKGAWAETKTFEDRIRLSHQDNRTLNKGKLRDLLASCKTHRLIETISTLYLNNVRGAVITSIFMNWCALLNFLFVKIRCAWNFIH